MVNQQLVRVLGTVLVTLQLVVVIYLAITITKPLPEREQKSLPLTGLKTWRLAPCPQQNSVGAESASEYFAALVTGVASLVCIYKNFRKYWSSNAFEGNIGTQRLNTGSNNPEVVTTGPEDIVFKFGHLFLFDSIITLYVIATFIAVGAGLIFDLGKLWAIFGIFHNVMEVYLIAALCYKKTANYVTGLIIFITIYSVAVTGATSQLSWYWDMLVFKSQGMVLDFILPVLLFIMSREKKEEENRPLLNQDLVPIPHLGYLVFAALAHLIGNTMNIAGGDSATANIVFQISYFVAYPIFAIYAHDQKLAPDALYKSANLGILDFILLVAWGITASAITALIAIKNLRCT